MTISEVIQKFTEGEAITIGDKQFDPTSFDEIRLDSGEMLFFAEDEQQGVLLSMDEESDEVILFQKIEEEIEIEDDIVVYGGVDYELSLEGSGQVLLNGVESETITFQDFEAGNGGKFRVVQYEVTGETRMWAGDVIMEEDIKEIL
jgi:hypothetical protein